MWRVETTAEWIGIWVGAHRLDLATEKTEAVVLRGLQNNEVVFQIGENLWEACSKGRDECCSRIMPNIGKPGSYKIAMLSGVVHPMLLYGVQKKKCSQCNDKYSSAYRTVSTRTIQAITGTPPIHILAKEKYFLHTWRDGHVKTDR
ncbi:hypothetical protein JTB14_031578 [Gonioctena quinquepunctata]|nr:hypothetical protein JTB14_031578 [Gonioctena quinquepunctata]